MDEYLSRLDDDRRAALTRLRELVHEWYPEASEKISYGMPTFVVDGHAIGGFLSHKDFCSWYPHSGSTLGTLAGQLGGRTHTKSALHFRVTEPLSDELFRTLLETRHQEFAG